MPLRNSDIIQIVKVGVAERPFYPTAKNEEWEPGGWNQDKSPPISYMSEGIVLSPPEVGTSFIFARTKRNNVECHGIFQTSKVLKIVETEYGIDIHTENSVYAVRVLERRESGESEWNSTNIN
jgi:hypothetical protein